MLKKNHYCTQSNFQCDIRGIPSTQLLGSYLPCVVRIGDKIFVDYPLAEKTVISASRRHGSTNDDAKTEYPESKD